MSLQRFRKRNSFFYLASLSSTYKEEYVTLYACLQSQESCRFVLMFTLNRPSQTLDWNTIISFHFPPQNLQKDNRLAPHSHMHSHTQRAKGKGHQKRWLIAQRDTDPPLRFQSYPSLTRSLFDNDRYCLSINSASSHNVHFLVQKSFLLLSRLARLQIVTRHKSASHLALHFRLPPAIILMAQDGEDVALCEPELLRDSGAIQIQSSCYSLVSKAGSKI